MNKLPSLIFMEIPDILSYIWEIAMLLALYVSVVMIFLAILDYAFKSGGMKKPDDDQTGGEGRKEKPGRRSKGQGQNSQHAV